ncbi:hypothetical protein HFP89_14525 [Wenzhouxiangella sp. XN79A]|uniref:hypothetical protein n=1 Tax=Wenzhouxiangella sp. XN79A TaxID=2724193 RepID=UPI00144AD654|nr:hypothetical protein [Wenzhouxiangella sp. XN79A]NKI36383.1 hypothetical protein [Wenzhouxiangella sp. XN79A]
MILRSITRHVREQNWFAVGLDFLIVVVGVFIGIQVANWNAERADRVEAGNVLERLEQEFQMHLERTDRSLAMHEASLAAAARLIHGIRDGRLEQDSLDQDIDVATGFATPPGPSTTFEELVSSGRLRLLQGTELRSALLGYNDYVSLVRSHYGVCTQPLGKAREELMRARTLVVTGVPSGGIDQAWTTEAVDQSVLLEKPELMAALQTLYGTQDNAHAVLLANRQRIRAILDLVEAAQDEQR